MIAKTIACFQSHMLMFYNSRKSSQVHSSLPSSIQSSAGLVHHQEKKLINTHQQHIVSSDSSPQEHLNFAQHSMSPSTSPVATSAAEGSQNKTMTALANAGYRGKYASNSAASLRSQQNEDNEKESMSNSDVTRDLNIISRNDLHRSKKLSWQHEDFQVNNRIICRYCSEF